MTRDQQDRPISDGDGAAADGGALRLVLPLPENLANARLHWRAKLARKKAYWRKLDLIRPALPPAPPAPLARAEIRATLYLYNPMDDDNAMARLKWAVDWLAGLYIAGDARKALKWVGIPEQVIDRKRPRVELVISALDNT